MLRVLRVVVADADRDHVELGPGLDGAVGAQGDGPAGAVELGQPERLDDVGLLQHQRQHVGPAQLGDVGDRNGLGRGVPAALTSQRSTPCAPGSRHRSRRGSMPPS